MHLYQQRGVPFLAGLMAAVTLATAQPGAAAPIDVAKFKAPIKVACVGDSITAGYHAGGKKAAWPGQLSGLLGDKWAVSNFGVSAMSLMKGGACYQNTADFKSALELNPDVVLIMLGSNDTKGRIWARKDHFAADYKDMIAQFAARPSKPVIFLCYPPWVGGQGGYGIHEEQVLEELPMIDKVAADLKLGVIDIHSVLKGKADLLPDNVHPSKEGAVLIAKTIYAALTGQVAPAAAPEGAPAAPAEGKKVKKGRKNK